VQIVAINAIGALGDEKGAAVLQTLLSDQPIEVQLASAGAIARVARKKNFTEQGMGQWMRTVEARARPLVLAYTESPQVPLRSQVAWTLGWFDDEQTMAALEKLLNDTDWQVRIAAAASVVRRAHRR